jgi:predicted nucleotidyltransferase
MMNAKVPLNRNVIAEFCRRWRIRELSVFGSVLREDFGPTSDLDVLVSFEPGAPVDALFGRSVELVEKEAMRNPWRRHEILKTRQVIYAA